MKKYIIPITIVLVLLLSIILVLAGNKKKLDKSKTYVDRASVPVAVSVAGATMELLDKTVKYPANIQPFDEAMVYAQTSGLIERLDIELGKQVTRGQVIGKIDTHILEINLQNALVNLQSAAVNRNKLLDDYNRAKDLLANKAGLEVNMLTAKSNYEGALNNYENAQIQINLIRQQIANGAIVSPLSGTVSAHKVKQGEYINPGTPIATITDINTLKTTVYVDQPTAYQLRKGQMAMISAPVFGTRQLMGNIIYISPVADANHNYQVNLLITHQEEIPLKGGTDVQVSFTTVAPKEALQIPRAALMLDAQAPYVYVVENSKAHLVTIKTGMIQNDKAEVLSGLKAGQTVITSGQINVKEGSTVSIIK